MLSYLSEILQNNQYALLTVFMFYMVRTEKGSDVEKVLLVYSVAGIFVFLGDFNPQSVFWAAFCVLFLWFEFFCFDTWRVRNFNFVGKAVDFLFRYLFIHGGFFFTLSMNAGWLLSQCQIRPKGNWLPLCFLIVAFIQCSRATFAIKPIGQIVDSFLTKTYTIDSWEEYAKHRGKYEILCSIEDKGYFTRREFKHRTSLLRMAFNFVRSICWRIRNKDFSGLAGVCGSGTIEMQLIRCVGLEFGSYRHWLRRKMFELVYSNLIINSYLRKFERRSPKRMNYRFWLIRVYLDSVPVNMSRSQINPASLSDGETTFSKVFGKSFEDLSNEEFFVWCLGLKSYQNGVGINAVNLHQDAIRTNKLDKTLIEEAVNRVQNRMSID